MKQLGRIAAATFFVGYLLVQGIAPSRSWWSNSRATMVWHMYDGRHDRTAGDFLVYFPGGRVERLRTVREHLATYFYRQDTDPAGDPARTHAIGMINVTVDRVRYALPYFCKAFPDAEAVSLRFSPGRETRLPCAR